jgi:hypothetical protein
VHGLPSVADAEELARELLAPLVVDWAHVRAVAARADGLTQAIEDDDHRQLVVVAAAAAASNTGSAPPRSGTLGCDQIDGARYLTAKGYADRLCSLVALHLATDARRRARAT